MFGFGSGLVYGIRSDIANSTPVRLGTMQDISIDISSDLKELYGQNQYAVAIARGKSKIDCKAKFATISGEVYNNLFFGGTLTTGSVSAAYQEAQTIPASSPYTVTVTNGAHFAQDLGPRYAATGIPFTLVASSPTVGQYTVNATTGVYTFAAADEGVAVLIDYLYTVSTTGTTVAAGNPLMGITPTFICEFAQEYNGLWLTVKLFQCISTKLTLATKIDDFVIPEFDFSAFANSAGQTIQITTSDSL
jgi:hypothetical protein